MTENPNTNEQVENAQIQPHGGSNVVGLAAADDAAGIKQDQPRHNHDDCGRECQRERRDV